ncbi:MAG TPA: hypothetical protein PLU72_10385 [Candidatus Ozemobacteraceae bacterium]|nr:hypothetical protein [Candidatus Ozemobacteraceae bacterium]HQG28469.1 hypothetical protein [Candidatus Ozemobacteraceae bacterium]
MFSRISLLALLCAFCVALVPVAGMAQTQELIIVDATIRVLESEKAFIDGYWEVTGLISEIVNLDADEAGLSVDQKAALAYLRKNAKQIRLDVFCSNEKQEIIHRTFLTVGHPKPASFNVKIAVDRRTMNNTSRYMVAVVDHDLK